MRVVNGAAVLRCLRAIVHAVIADYAGNTEPIVLEDFRPAFGLVFAMQRHIAPCGEGIFIAEKRQRQDLALVGQALEAFDRDKAVNGFQNWPQLGREIEVFLLVLGLRPDFVTLRKKVRSSARMNLFSSAKSKLTMPWLSARSRAR